MVSSYCNYSTVTMPDDVQIYKRNVGVSIGYLQNCLNTGHLFQSYCFYVYRKIILMIPKISLS